MAGRVETQEQVSSFDDLVTIRRKLLWTRQQRNLKRLRRHPCRMFNGLMMKREETVGEDFIRPAGFFVLLFFVACHCGIPCLGLRFSVIRKH